MMEVEVKTLEMSVYMRDRRFQVSKYGIIEVAKEGKNEGSVGN